jgi:hypothetical protein
MTDNDDIPCLGLGFYASRGRGGDCQDLKSEHEHVVPHVPPTQHVQGLVAAATTCDSQSNQGQQSSSIACTSADFSYRQQCMAYYKDQHPQPSCNSIVGHGHDDRITHAHGAGQLGADGNETVAGTGTPQTNQQQHSSQSIAIPGWKEGSGQAITLEAAQQQQQQHVVQMVPNDVAAQIAKSIVEQIQAGEGLSQSFVQSTRRDVYGYGDEGQEEEAAEMDEAQAGQGQQTQSQSQVAQQEGKHQPEQASQSVIGVAASKKRSRWGPKVDHVHPPDENVNAQTSTAQAPPPYAGATACASSIMSTPLQHQFRQGDTATTLNHHGGYNYNISSPAEASNLGIHNNNTVSRYTTEGCSIVSQNLLHRVARALPMLPPPMPPEEASEKRHRFFAEKEEPRKHAALIRNFEYIHAKEEEKLKQQLTQLQRQSDNNHENESGHGSATMRMRQQNSNHYNSSNYSHSQQQISSKQQGLLTTKAGIGTKIRTAAVKTFGKVLHTASQSSIKKNKEQESAGKAIYVSGLTPFTKESTLRQLFESFGPLQRFTLYNSKATGRLKGDALVVFKTTTQSPSDDTDKADNNVNVDVDVDAICNQVSVKSYIRLVILLQNISMLHGICYRGVLPYFFVLTLASFPVRFKSIYSLLL